jgi:hypothetical protein
MIVLRGGGVWRSVYERWRVASSRVVMGAAGSL